MSNSVNDLELIEKIDHWALEIRQHAREQMSQNHMSPTEYSWMMRLIDFLENDIKKEIKSKKQKRDKNADY
jgi:hypothetical protein